MLGEQSARAGKRSSTAGVKLRHPFSFSFVGLGEPYGKTPWEILETWSWERIAIVVQCFEDQAKIARKRSESTSVSGVVEMTEEQFIAGMRK